MSRQTLSLTRLSIAVLACCAITSVADAQTKLDEYLAQDNTGRELLVADKVDDWTFLRRVYVDLVGRIPGEKEIDTFFAMPEATRRDDLIEKLLADPRFNDRWMVFFADMLRIRSGVQGGPAFLAYVHKSLREEVPYDKMCQELISANGKAKMTPEIGFILGDDVDPMALAGATSQVFMGVRIACAQCHDHPFDVWTRREFYGFAAYFGKTQRMVAPVTETLYTTETDKMTVLWPPDDPEFEGETRIPVTPEFPFAMDKGDRPSKVLARFNAVRAEEVAVAQARANAKKEASLVDDLLEEAGEKAVSRTNGEVPSLIDVKKEVKAQTNSIDIYGDLYRRSELRKELASLVTSPRNRYFSKSLVNRVWKEMMGFGFVEPVDDFSDGNAASHPETLDYIADEFVASGFDFRTVIRLIAQSDAYQRAHITDVGEGPRASAERAFTATPVRRMLAESLYDSIVQAGHLFDRKYTDGFNQVVIEEQIRVPINEGTGEVDEKALALLEASKKPSNMTAMAGMQGMAGAAMGGGAYNLEQAIELDFEAVLAEKEDAPKVDSMKAMSAEEIEAMRMEKEAASRPRPNMKYEFRMVKRTIDVNPTFASAMRMASPASPSHFLRVFGQPSRVSLGEHREQDPSMRQSLMMLNGSLTHEASRVGNLEEVHNLLVGEKRDTASAIRLAYREILTRNPTETEMEDAVALLKEYDSPLEGMADLRWILLNCHEFRFIP